MSRHEAMGLRRSTGFTLVELLVVIGIIALLISILLPSLQKARASAVKVACMSNLRQVGLSIEMYAMENQGVYPEVQTPPWLLPAGEDQFKHIWWRHVAKTIGSSKEGWPSFVGLKALQCPTQTGKFMDLISPEWQEFPSYGMSAMLGASTVNPDCYNLRVKVVQVRRSSQKVLCSEASFNQWTANASISPWGGYGTGMSQAACDGPNDLNYRMGVHSGYSNILYCDGHVEPFYDVKILEKAPYFRGDILDVWTPNDAK